MQSADLNHQLAYAVALHQQRCEKAGEEYALDKMPEREQRDAFFAAAGAPDFENIITVLTYGFSRAAATTGNLATNMDTTVGLCIAVSSLCLLLWVRRRIASGVVLANKLRMGHAMLPLVVCCAVCKQPLSLPDASGAVRPFFRLPCGCVFSCSPQ